jgi:hypothetical protein
MRAHLTTPLVLVALAATGCGQHQRHDAVSTVPADRRQQTSRTSIVVRGDYAPDEHGPFVFAGRYAVRFVQRGAGVDFAGEVPFTAHLEQPDPDGPGQQVKLFQKAARTGRTEITARGRFRVVVDYGDSPYEIRFVRAGGSRGGDGARG